ncbi:FCD domain-containing protein [Nonomuraea sp. NPDC005983]
MEPSVARPAALRRTPEQLDALRQTLDAMAAATRCGSRTTGRC